MVKAEKRRYQCRICDIRFTRQDHVSRHMASNHGIVRYACGICGLTTARRDGLRRHMENKHGIKLPIPRPPPPPSQVPSPQPSQVPQPPQIPIPKPSQVPSPQPSQFPAPHPSQTVKPSLPRQDIPHPEEDVKPTPSVWNVISTPVISQGDEGGEEEILPLPLSLPVFPAAKQEQTPLPSTSREVLTTSSNSVLKPQFRHYTSVQPDTKVSSKPPPQGSLRSLESLVRAVEPSVSEAAAARPSPSPLTPSETPHPPAAEAPLPPPVHGNPINIKWNTYAKNMSTIMPSLLEDEKFVDVTLACEGKSVKCHKVILGACSPYFEKLLSENPCEHPIILMRDFQFWEIRAIVDFIYCGNVNIPQQQLPQLLQVASVLQIKGLTGTQKITEPSEDSQARLLNEDSSKIADNSRGSQSHGYQLRKRTESAQTTQPRASEVPKKKKKFISTSTVFESYISDESSDHSDIAQATNPAPPDPLAPSPSMQLSRESENAQATPATTDPLAPSPLMQPLLVKTEPNLPTHSRVSIKEETNFGWGGPYYPYRNDQNMDRGRGSQLPMFQLLPFPSSRNIKQEIIEDLVSSNKDPLDSASGNPLVVKSEIETVEID